MSLIIKGKDLGRRRDGRTDAEMEDQLQKGLSFENATIKFLVDRIRERIPSLEHEAVGFAVDNRPDLKLMYDGRVAVIEIQKAIYAYDSARYNRHHPFANMGPVFHVKRHKIRNLVDYESTGCRSLLVTGVLNGTFEGIYVLENRDLSGVISQGGEIAPMGNKPGFAIPLGKIQHRRVKPPQMAAEVLRILGWP